jgi:hypothetical protein
VLVDYNSHGDLKIKPTSNGQCRSLRDGIRARTSSKSGWCRADSDIGRNSGCGQYWRGHGIIACWCSTGKGDRLGVSARAVCRH